MFVVGASRRSAAPGSQAVVAAGYGGVLSLRFYAVAVWAKSEHRALLTKAACSCARPNPSIEADKQRRVTLVRFGYAVPPLFAPHLKR